MLKIKNIRAGYGKINVLWDVSMKVDEKEIVALVGANAAGKTTLLNTISGLIPSVSGSMEFLGRPIKDMPPYRIAKMGMAHVPEGGKLFLDMSVLENLEMGAYAIRDKAAIRTSLEKVFHLFPILAERRTQTGGTLSGGEQQMLALGRALMTRPRILLLDEPSLGLAPLIVAQVFETIRELKADGTTILLVEQNAHLALKTADRAYVMETGRITMEGKGRDLLGDPAIRAAYLGE